MNIAKYQLVLILAFNPFPKRIINMPIKIEAVPPK